MVGQNPSVSHSIVPGSSVILYPSLQTTFRASVPFVVDVFRELKGTGFTLNVEQAMAETKREFEI